LIPI
jgi:hypothetical protein